MKSHICVLAAVGMLAGAALAATTPPSTPATPATAAAPQGKQMPGDGGFLTEALTAGRKEVADATRAANHTSNAEVKKATQDLIKDHTAANSELEAMATSRHVVVDEHAAPEQAPEAAYSDRAYVQQQIAAHRKAIELFERESASGQDRDVKAFAAKTLPKLQEHLTMLEQVSAHIG